MKKHDMHELIYLSHENSGNQLGHELIIYLDLLSVPYSKK